MQINGRDGTGLRRRSAVDKYNEFADTIKLSFLNGNLMVPNGSSSSNFTQALRFFCERAAVDERSYKTTMREAPVLLGSPIPIVSPFLKIGLDLF